MEKMIVYQKSLIENSELIELFQNQGFDPMFVSDNRDMISASGQGFIGGITLEINSLSDVRLVHTARLLLKGSAYKTIVFVKNQALKELIDILKGDDYQIVDDYSNLKKILGNHKE
jgi:formylmethanofuran dehydrogenase subunit B